MTKFGKHPDQDIVDLASEAVQGALTDAGVTMKDIGIIGARQASLMAMAPTGQMGAEAARARPASPSTTSPSTRATGAHRPAGIGAAMASEGRRDRQALGLAFGVEKLSARRPGWRAGAARPTPHTWTPHGRHGLGGRGGRGGSAPRTMPGVVTPRSASSTPPQVRRARASSSSPRSRREEPLRTRRLNPKAAYTKKMTLDEIMNDVMIAYPEHAADVLGQLRRRRRRLRGRIGRQAQDAVARAAEAGGQDLGLDPHDGPVGGGLPDPPRRQHVDPQRSHAGIRAGRRRPQDLEPGGAAGTTASPPPSWCTTTT